MSHPLALPLATVDPYRQWAVLGIVFLLAAGFAVFNVVLSSLLGPGRKGKVKDAPYESGVDPSGDTHQRFNVRFYLVAMIFLVFDVEILFFIPWVVLFPRWAQIKAADPAWAAAVGGLGGLFTVVIVFTAIVLLAYVYAWAKGVLKWD